MTSALQYWAFTYNAGENNIFPHDRETFIGFLNERGWRWVFQEEKGEKTGRSHWQGRIDLRSQEARVTKKTLLDIFKAGGVASPLLQIDPESNNSIKKDGALFYVTKYDTRVAGPWHDASFEPPKKPYVYEGKDLRCMQNPLPWQQTVLDATAEDCEDDRKVCWVYNGCGNVGKSKLQKYMCWKLGCKRVSLGTATQIKTAVADAGMYKKYVCNLPRVSGNQESQRDLFSALEDIKDGWVESCMYGKDHKLKMEPPHLWIFSNELPDLSLASEDRWTVYQIEDKFEPLRLMSNAEVMERVREEKKAERELRQDLAS